MKKILFLVLVALIISVKVNACPAVVIPIVGQVTGPTGRIVPNATVVFVKQDGTDTRSTVTDLQGNYESYLINCSTYDISVMTNSRMYFETFVVTTPSPDYLVIELNFVGISRNPRFKR